MGKDKHRVIVTYNGVDGFCSAAMALMRYPGAELVLSSAAKIGRTLSKLAKSEKEIAEIHLCGIGVFCEWEEAEKPARELKVNGTEIIWYCGRGYLEGMKAKLEKVSDTVFDDVSTNTKAIHDHLGLETNLWAKKLIEIAESDPNIPGSSASSFVADWRDFILSAITGYLKYQDEEICPSAIHKLITLELSPREDREAIKRYRMFSDHNIIRGSSEKMKNLRRLIAKCSAIEEPIILTGESGTGKEYAAQLIHEGSKRSGEHFQAVNCAIFSGNPGLANSALFGHVQGAFTGAVSNRKGAFLCANSGTLFLDELCLLPVEIQGKLLRALEEGVIMPEGCDNPIKIDVRIIAATNQDLPKMIRRREFLPDLYHRINTIRIELPPLRTHTEDIQTIAREKLTELKKDGFKLRLTKKDYDAMSTYDWPGNVRQLFKLIKRVAYLGITVQEAIDDDRKLGSLEYGCGEEDHNCLYPESLEDVKDFEDVKSLYFQRAWELANQNYAEAARRMGIAVNTLRKHIETDS
jgi:DNA-binding NtrC family response regulator